MTSTVTSLQNKEQTKKILAAIEQQQTPEQAQAKISSLPAVMAYEARFALQHLKENVDPVLYSEVVEPLARISGWAEALAFAFQTGSVGTQVPMGNGKQQGR